jgi:hypothetical protein
MIHYRSEARALKRLSYLRRYGIWTGLIHDSQGYRLAYDPGDVL